MVIEEGRALVHGDDVELRLSHCSARNLHSLGVQPPVAEQSPDTIALCVLDTKATWNSVELVMDPQSYDVRYEVRLRLVDFLQQAREPTHTVDVGSRHPQDFRVVGLVHRELPPDIACKCVPGNVVEESPRILELTLEQFHNVALVEQVP